MIRVTLPGQVAEQLLNGTGWPDLCPTGAAALERGEWRRRGRGRQLAVELDLEDARSLVVFIDGYRTGVSDTMIKVLWQRAGRQLQAEIDKA